MDFALTGSAAPPAPAPTFSDPGERYVPGVCNISPAERATRRQFGWAAAITTLGIGVVLVVGGAPHLLRLVVALPAAGSALGFLQAHRHFCVAFAGRGVTDLTADGTLASIDAEAARRADRRASNRLVRDAVLIGLAVAAAFALSPI
jgi:hypothetical protein